MRTWGLHWDWLERDPDLARRPLCLFSAPRSAHHGPLLQRRKTRLADGFPVTRFMLFEQTGAHQKRDAAFANLDLRDQDHAP